MMKTLRVLLLLVAGPAFAAAVPRGYVEHSRLALGQGQGSFQVLWDESLEKELRAKGGDEARAYDYVIYKKDHKTNPGIVLYLNAKGEVEKTFVLEKPVVSLKSADLDGPGPVFEVVVDYSIGMGSYNGPISFFLRVAEGKADWLMAKEMDNGKTEKIHAMRSLKTVWAVTDRKTILKAACRPNFHKGSDGSRSDDFMIHYYRYSLKKSGWKLYHSQKPGYSDFEEETIPPRSSFP